MNFKRLVSVVTLEPTTTVMTLLQSVTNPGNETVSYNYNSAGQVTTITDARSNVTSFGYTNGFQTSKTWADNKTETFVYDAFGRLITHTLPDNTTRQYWYNALNQRTEERASSGNGEYDVVTTTYDKAGNRDIVTVKRGVNEFTLQPVVTTNYDVDALNRVTSAQHTYGTHPSVTGRAEERVQYQYDAAGNVRTMKTTVGGTLVSDVENLYDAQGRLQQVIDHLDADKTTVYEYYSTGLVKNVTLPSTPQVIADYTYNGRNQLDTLTYKQNGATDPLASFNYDVDASGNRTQLIETLNGATQTVTWEYFPTNRLKNEKRYSGSGVIAGNLFQTTSYQYDASGNRMQEWIGNGSVTRRVTDYTDYNANDQVTTMTVTEGTNHKTYNYSYDGRGNLTYIDCDSNLTALCAGSDDIGYAYDAHNRLTLAAGQTTIYDHDGRRIQQGGTTFVWDELSRYGDVIYETSGSDTTTYTLGAGQLIAQTKNGSKDYFLRDGQHSTRALIASAATITQTFSYTPYGELINADGSLIQNPAPATRYLYTGQQYDAASNLYSLRARYYDPSDGRFLSRDTWAYNFQNPVELNRYGYVAGNPVNAWDPSGAFQEYVMINNNTKTASWKWSEFAWSTIEGGIAGIVGYELGLAAGSYIRALYENLVLGTNVDIKSRALEIQVLNRNQIDQAMSVISGAFQGLINYTSITVLKLEAWRNREFTILGGMLSTSQARDLLTKMTVAGLLSGTEVGLHMGLLSQLIKDTGINWVSLGVNTYLTAVSGTVTHMLSLYMSLSHIPSIIVSTGLNTMYNVIGYLPLNQLTVNE